MNGKPWTPEEDDFLINGSDGLTDEQIAELLGRTVHSIWGHRMTLRKQGKFIGYKEKEIIPMNVGYDKNNCADAARRIGVTMSCVQRWCRENIINCTNVSDGDKKSRYLIDEDEIMYLKKLVKSHGIRKAMNFYNKDHNKKTNVSKGAIIVETNPVIPKAVIKAEEPVVVEPKHSSGIDEKIPCKKFDVDDLIYHFERIQDLKEELENLEARRNQINNEIASLRETIMAHC